MLFFHLRLGLPSGLLPSGLPTSYPCTAKNVLDIVHCLMYSDVVVNIQLQYSEDYEFDRHPAL
jgi:hypothetical protein